MLHLQQRYWGCSYESIPLNCIQTQVVADAWRINIQTNTNTDDTMQRHMQNTKTQHTTQTNDLRHANPTPEFVPNLLMLLPANPYGVGNVHKLHPSPWANTMHSNWMTHTVAHCHSYEARTIT